MTASKRRAGAAALAAWLAACAGGSDGAAGPAAPPDPADPDDPTNPTAPGGPAGWALVARAPAGPLSVAIYAPGTLGTGLVPLALRVTDAAGASVADATVALTASRPHADGTTLAAPSLAPPALAPDGTYRLELVLPEAAPAASGWGAEVSVARAGAGAVTASFAGLAVAERHLAQPFGGGPSTYLLGVRFDGALRVGLNPVTVALHASSDGGASWAPVAGATFAVVPDMPSMGHGAAGSVAPTPSGADGRYAGAVALSMPGDWEIAFTVTRDAAALGGAVVPVYF